MGICGCVTPSPNCPCHRNIIGMRSPGLHVGDPTWVGWRQQPADSQKDLKDLLDLLGVTKIDFANGANPQPPIASLPAPKPYNEGWADGYREAYEQGKTIGFESGKEQGFQEGCLHGARHLEETLALQALQQTAESLPDVEWCSGGLSIADASDGSGLVICCEDCGFVEEIEDDLSVRGLNERLNALHESGHELCEEE